MHRDFAADVVSVLACRHVSPCGDVCTPRGAWVCTSLHALLVVKHPM